MGEADCLASMDEPGTITAMVSDVASPSPPPDPGSHHPLPPVSRTRCP